MVQSKHPTVLKQCAEPFCFRLVSTLKGKREVFDGIILTMPVPQIFQLNGTIKTILG